MKKITMVKAEISEKQRALASLEKKWQEKRRSLDHRYNDLDLRQRHLRRMIEKKYKTFLQSLENASVEKKNSKISLLEKELTGCLQLVEEIFMECCSRLDEEDFRLENTFKEEHQQLQSDLKRKYQLYRQLQLRQKRM